MIAYVPDSELTLDIDLDVYDEYETVRNLALMSHGGFVETLLVNEAGVFIPGTLHP